MAVMGTVANEVRPTGGKKNTLQNEEWVNAVCGLAKAGLSIADIRVALVGMGQYAPHRKTIKQYIRDGLITGVTESEHENAIKKAKARAKSVADPLAIEWKRTVQEMLSQGRTISDIQNRLTKRGLHPTAKATITRRLEDGYFAPQVTCKSYEIALQKREQNQSQEWIDAVAPLLKQGILVEDISMELKKKNISPNSPSTINKRLESGGIPGFTVRKYNKAVEARREKQMKRWAKIVGKMLDEGETLTNIHLRLVKENLPCNSQKLIVKLLDEGIIPGRTWSKACENNNKRWGEFVYDLMDTGTPINEIRNKLIKAGMKPNAMETVRRRLEHGTIAKDMPDGSVRVMTKAIYMAKKDAKENTSGGEAQSAS